MKKYVLKSTSTDGIYFLVNGWHRSRAIWMRNIAPDTFFKRPQDAKMCYSKLIKVMPEYSTDNIEIMEVAS